MQQYSTFSNEFIIRFYTKCIIRNIARIINQTNIREEDQEMLRQ